MTSPNETAYPRIKADLSEKDLEQVYTPTAEEHRFIDGIVSRPTPRVGMLIWLKLYQRLGRLVVYAEVPAVIRAHIAQAAGVLKPPSLKELQKFERSGMRMSRVKELREHLQLRPMDEAARAWLDHVAEGAAETKHSVADIINVMLEELVHHRYELPAFSTLDRAAFRAREESNNKYFTALAGTLGPETKATIDELLNTPEGSAYSGWNVLKREPKRPTNKETRVYLQHVQHLQRIVEALPKPDLPIPKLRQFRHLARALDAAEMAKLKPQKRYALAVVFIRSQYAQSLDDAADMFIRMMQNLENAARQRLLMFQQDRIQKTDMLVSQLKDCLQAYSINGTERQRVDAIETSLMAPIEELIADCDEHLAYAGKNFLPFLLQPYKAVRAQLLNCIQISAPKSSSNDLTNERMLAALQSLRANRFDHVRLDELNLDPDKDFHWMSAQWRKLVLLKTTGSAKFDAVVRRFFELAVMQMIKDELKCGDLFIKHGERYDDYREQLVDDVTFEKEIADYGLVTGIDVKADAFVAKLKNELLEKAKEVDASFPRNAHAEIVDGRLVLRKPTPSEASPEIALLDRLLAERMESVSIMDVLIDAERWLDLHKMFRPLAGTDSRVDDLRLRVITTLFCYGCNLGPQQTSKSIRGLSRKQISWLNLKYVSEDLLDKAIIRVINAFEKFELPSYWGTGKHASADGTKWNLHEQNLISEYHIRYGGYGGIGYYHVSDKYIALFSRFISCGTYEGIHILDIFENQDSDIKPDTLHGDTQAQSLPVFALAHLLGIKLMPRIRGIQDLTFFRPSVGAVFENIDDLFGGTINWSLIETHLPAMFRIGVSIKLGKISPSAILRRLGTHNKKNKLYFAFQELGKVIRTTFLLGYVGDVELRRVIHAETNKSEQFNDFAHWTFFGGEGIIAENLRHEQRKLIKYNHLVANLIILYNVHEMTRVLHVLQNEGMELTPEVLAGIAPYRRRHINRFGDYTLNFRRKLVPMEIQAPKLISNQ